MTDMSVEAPKSPSRRKLLIAAGALGGVAVVGGAAALLGGQRSPDAVTASPTPTGTSEPSPTNTTEPTRSPEPTKSPEPTPDPVEMAIKNGELKLNGEKDWERYFVGITPEEAEQLLKSNDSVTSNEDFKFLLPFDPSKSPNLLLKNVGFTTPGGRQVKLIAVNNLSLNTSFYANENGSGKISEDRFNSSFGLSFKGNILSWIIPKENSKNLVSNSAVLKMGTPAVIIGSNGPLEYSTRFSMGENQAVFGFGRANFQANDGSISNLLRKEGKIAFIVQT